MSYLFNRVSLDQLLHLMELHSRFLPRQHGRNQELFIVQGQSDLKAFHKLKILKQLKGKSNQKQGNNVATSSLSIVRLSAHRLFVSVRDHHGILPVG